MATAEEIIERAGPFLDLYLQAAQKNDIDPAILIAQGFQESNFNPKAVSSAGAQGISQFMPGTAKDYGLADPFDPIQAIHAQARYMRKGLDDNGGDETLAFAAYNAGQGNVNKYGGVPPFKETQDYVSKIGSTLPEIRRVLSERGMLPGGKDPVADLTKISPEVVADAGVVPGQPIAGIPATDGKKSKGSLVSNLTAVLAALSGVGGAFANTVGAFRNTGSPGDAAIKQSQGLLEVLNERQKSSDADKEFSGMIERSNAPAEVKNMALAAGRAGDIKRGLELITGPMTAKQKAAAELESKRAEATDPVINKFKNYQKLAEEARDFKTFKSKEDYQQQLKLSLEAAKAKNKEMSPAAMARQDRILETINKELGPITSVQEGLKSIESSLTQIPSGRFSGTAAEGINKLTGNNPAFKEYNSSVAAIKSNLSKAFGQVGALTDKDVKFVEDSLPKPSDTPEERKKGLETVKKFIAKKVQGYKKIVLRKPDAASLGDFIDDFVGEYPIEAETEAATTPAATATPSSTPKASGGVNMDLLKKYGGRVVSE